MDTLIIVEILRNPTEQDWTRCKMLAMNTIGKEFVGSYVSNEWRYKILKSQHSPIRTLWFTIKMVVPSFVSVHFVRHKIGIEHYVQSQRNDRQNDYDRNSAPQDTMVSHIFDVNAEQLMFMSNRRLCNKTDVTTKYVMGQICLLVEKTNPEFIGSLKPMCEKIHECPEFKTCGYWDRVKTTRYI